jgi:branched-chain amino acid transport system substrate-binding protein
VLAAGGSVLAERYVPVGDVDHDSIVRQILDYSPHFIFNTLIGDSAYEFFRALRRAAKRAGIDQPRAMPIASCSLSEPELAEIGTEASDGHISSSVYFESISTDANASFTRAYRRRFPGQRATSADAEASYNAVHLLARALEAADSEDMPTVRSVLTQIEFDAPQGPVRIDSDNRHSYLTPRIGVSNSQGGFDIIFAASQPIKPDPYLIWDDFRHERPARPVHLKVVK